MGGGQPLVELVVDGRQDGLQPRHIDLSVVVQRVEPVVTEGFDHVPDVHQVNCEGGKQAGGDQSSVGTNVRLQSVKKESNMLLRLHLFCTNRSLQAVL